MVTLSLTYLTCAPFLTGLPTLRTHTHTHVSQIESNRISSMALQTPRLQRAYVGRRPRHRRSIPFSFSVGWGLSLPPTLLSPSRYLPRTQYAPLKGGKKMLLSFISFSFLYFFCLVQPRLSHQHSSRVWDRVKCPRARRGEAPAFTSFQVSYQTSVG